MDWPRGEQFGDQVKGLIGSNEVIHNGPAFNYLNDKAAVDSHSLHPKVVEMWLRIKSTLICRTGY